MLPDEFATQVLVALDEGKREIILATGSELCMALLRRQDPEQLFDRMSSMVHDGYVQKKWLPAGSYVYQQGNICQVGKHYLAAGNHAVYTSLSHYKEGSGLMDTFRLISADEVRTRLSQKICIPLVRTAMIALSAGKTRQALRQIIDLGDGNAFGSMPGGIDGVCHGAKLISVFPGNVVRGGKAHEGVIMLFDPDTGVPDCAVDAGEVTAIRTAAASAVATDALARKEARTLAILGTGEQAWQHAVVMCEVRPIQKIRLWGRDAIKAKSLGQRIHSALGVPVEICDDVAKACAGADIICTTTGAKTPVLMLSHVQPGTHINAVGSSRAGPTEIDPHLIPASLYVPDHRAGVIAQGSEFLEAVKLGIADENNVGHEIGAILADPAKGRSSDGQVTIYKSLGSVVQDIAAAHWLAHG